MTGLVQEIDALAVQVIIRTGIDMYDGVQTFSSTVNERSHGQLQAAYPIELLL